MASTHDSSTKLDLTVLKSLRNSDVTEIQNVNIKTTLNHRPLKHEGEDGKSKIDVTELTGA